ncbi:MAG: hypothetical protein HOP33_03695 [Verrucomicrobia bacterium]|nr:hypothetical protein [Verrucomicrobiota bacterium]
MRTPTLLLVGCLATIVGVVASCSSTSDGRSVGEHRRIAEGCMNVLRSARTNETTISPLDPRPEWIFSYLNC